MRLEGLHHVTAITGDAPGNVDFHTRVMGMRLVKKTVNQDEPSVYHLFYGDDDGSPGFDLTFFEYPGARRGVAGDGMVHTVAFRVAGDAALDFWAERLAGEGIESRRGDGALGFASPEGLGLELRVEEVPDAPLVAEAPDIPAEYALRGFAGVRAYASAPERGRRLLEEVLGFNGHGPAAWESRGALRGGWIAYETPPEARGMPGAGTVHHVAWAAATGDIEAWQERVASAGARATPVVERFYFRSVYFREPSGVLFELATMGPGFSVDEDEAHLGETLSLPPFLESRREQIEAVLTPLPPVTRAPT